MRWYMLILMTSGKGASPTASPLDTLEVDWHVE
jgi:hypothetical protein